MAASDLKVGIQITVNANQASSSIADVKRQLSDVKPVLDRVFDSAVINPFNIALSSVITTLTNLDTVANQVSTGLKTVANVSTLVGGRFEQVGAVSSKTAGQIDGFSASVKFAIKIIENLTQPTTALAKYTIGLGNSFSYTVGKFDSIITSASLAYKAFDLLPPKLKAVAVAMGTLNLVGHTVSGTFHLLTATTYNVLVSVTNLGIGVARAGISFGQMIHSIGSGDAILEKMSLGLSKISQAMYSVGAFTKILGGNWSVLGQGLLKASGLLSSTNIAFTQFSKTVLGTGNSVKLLAGVMRLLTVQPQYVSGIMGGLAKTVTLAAESFSKLSLSAKAAVIAIGLIGTASRVVSTSFTLLKSSVNVVATGLGVLKPAIGAIISAFEALKAIAMTALPVLGFLAVKSADSIATLQARVHLATQSTDEFNYSLQKLNQLSVDTGASIDGFVNIFARANKPIKDMGGNFQSTAAFAETLSKSLALGGATTSETNSVLLQTSQMLAKTKFSGDEFMSLMENGPQVMDAMTKALGKTKGELIEMAGDQKLSSEMVVYALLKQKKEVDEAYNQLPITVGRAFNQLLNVAKQYTGFLTDETGKAAQAISDFAKNAAASLASGQFAQELKAISAEFSLLTKDIKQTSDLFAGDVIFGSFENFFIKLRTTVRTFVIDTMAEFDKFKASAEYFFSFKWGAGQEESNKRLAIRDIEKNRADMVAQTEKEATDAIEKANAERAKGILLLKDYNEQQEKNRATDAKAVDDTIKTLETKVQKSLADAEKQSGKSKIDPSNLTGKFDEKIARSSKKYGYDFETVLNAYESAGSKFGVNPELLKAISNKETGGSYNPRIESPKGAVGLGQFMPDTAKHYGLKDRTDPVASIYAMANMIGDLIKKEGSIALALAAYNGGHGGADYLKRNPQFIENPDYNARKGAWSRETADYVKKILESMDGELAAEFQGQLKLQENQQQAAFNTAQSTIDLTVKQAEFESKNAIDNLKRLKEQGKIGIDQYWNELTVEQEKQVKANIDAIKANMDLARKEFDAAKLSAAPEDLPKIEADFKINNAKLQQELEHLKTELANIKPLNLIDAEKEIAKAKKVADEAQAALRDDALQGTSLAPKKEDPQLGKLTDARQSGAITFDEFNKATDEVKNRTDETFQGLVSLGTSTAQALQKGFADFLFDPFHASLKDMALGFLTTMRRMLADAIANAAIKAILDGITGSVGGTASSSGKGGGSGAKDSKGAVTNIVSALFGGAGLSMGGGGGGGLSSGASSAATAFSGGGGGASAFDGILEGFTSLFSMFHDGGVVGEASRSISVNPLAFAGALRYHTGGIAGLKSDEVPAVLRKGEEVLTANDPRHRNNRSASQAAGNVTSIVVMDPNFVPDAMSGQAGSKIVIQHIRDNQDAIRQMLA